MQSYRVVRPIPMCYTFNFAHPTGNSAIRCRANRRMRCILSLGQRQKRAINRSVDGTLSVDGWENPSIPARISTGWWISTGR